MKSRFFLITLIFIVSGMTYACQMIQTEPSDVEAPSLVSALPEGDEIPGWKREGEPFVARGMAGLAQQINGGAPFYIDRGVQESVFHEYANEDNSIWISVVLHQTARLKDAESLYRDIYAESPLSLPDLGKEGRALPELIGAYSIEFIKGPVFAKLTVNNKAETCQSLLLSFAEKIAARLP